MRWRAWWLGLGLACSCTTPPPPVIDGATFCARAVEAIDRGVAACCGAIGPSAEIQSFADACRVQLAPLVDDPRAGFDSAQGAALLEQLEASVARCQPGTGGSASFLALRDLFPGSLGAGTDCLDTVHPGSALSLLACHDGFCRIDPAGSATCVPYAPEGGACTDDLACQDGLHCTRSGTSASGACARPQPSDAVCTRAAECASGYCPAGHCVAQSPSQPQSLCDTPAPVTDRAVDLTLTGVAADPSIRATLRILDASLAPVVVVELDGVRGSPTSEHVPHALSSDTPYLAQVTLTSPVDPTRTWEWPIAAGTGAVVVDVDATLASMPLTATPPSSFDSSFDVQTFDFDLEVGHPFAVRVVDVASGRTRAQMRLSAIPGPMFELTILDAVVPGDHYRLLFVVDVNDDGVYQPPPVDHAWSALAQAPPSGGLSLPYPWSSSYQDVGF